MTDLKKQSTEVLMVVFNRATLAMVFLLSHFVCMDHCGAQPATGDSVDSPVKIQLLSKQVAVEVENPDEHKFELYAVRDQIGAEPGPQARTWQLVHQDGRKRVFYLLDAGKYVIVDKANQTTHAVPALPVGNRKPLRITIGAETELETEFSLIHGGPALIGDEIGIGQSDEQLSIQYVSPFWLGRHEVTNEKYVAFLNARGRCDEAWLDLGSRKCRIKPGQPNSFVTTKPKEPVVMVSLAGAQAYCEWLTETTGKKHRLPTEVEWEKAARGSKSTLYSYGSRYVESLANQQSGTIRDVGSFPASDRALFDMTGNVFEWMGNKYDATKADGPMNQALRGGSFVLDGMYLRNSFRMRQSPTVMTDDIGFRVLREVQAKTAKGQ